MAIRPLALSALTVLLLVTACGATPVARPVNSAAPATVARAAERASWQQLPLVDARTGESFTLADFAGKTVYVEPMATWCTNCRQQLRTVRDIYTQLDAERTPSSASASRRICRASSSPATPRCRAGPGASPS